MIYILCTLHHHEPELLEISQRFALTTSAFVGWRLLAIAKEHGGIANNNKTTIAASNLDLNIAISLVVFF